MVKVSLSILSQKHETCQSLRENIYELKSLDKSLSSEGLVQIHAHDIQVPQMADTWQKIILEFVNNFFIFKENKYCLEEHIQCIETQRKAIYLLIKNISLAYAEKQ